MSEPAEQNKATMDQNFGDERFVPGHMPGAMALEHWHRYLFAAQLVSQRSVLDVASGEGYGSHLLSHAASSVVGVDVSPAAQAHAARTYRRKNLRYVEASCTALPFEAATFDVVVSFETIEHIDEHESMLTEVRRVLRPNGLLIMSSPNKLEYTDRSGVRNPHHVHELYVEEFEQLIRDRFRHVRLCGQRVVAGSLIDAGSEALPMRVHRQGSERMLSQVGLPQPLYVIAVASDEDLPAIGHGLLEQDVSSLYEEDLPRDPDTTRVLRDLAGHDRAPLVEALNNEWYRQQNPDLGLAGVDPVAHWFDQGASEGRLPMPRLSSMLAKLAARRIGELDAEREAAVRRAQAAASEVHDHTRYVDDAVGRAIDLWRHEAEPRWAAQAESLRQREREATELSAAMQRLHFELGSVQTRADGELAALAARLATVDATIGEQTGALEIARAHQSELAQVRTLLTERDRQHGAIGERLDSLSSAIHERARETQAAVDELRLAQGVLTSRATAAEQREQEQRNSLEARIDALARQLDQALQLQARADEDQAQRLQQLSEGMQLLMAEREPARAREQLLAEQLSSLRDQAEAHAERVTQMDSHHVDALRQTEAGLTAQLMTALATEAATRQASLDAVVTRTDSLEAAATALQSDWIRSHQAQEAAILREGARAEAAAHAAWSQALETAQQALLHRVSAVEAAHQEESARSRSSAALARDQLARQLAMETLARQSMGKSHQTALAALREDLSHRDARHATLLADLRSDLDARLQRQQEEWETGALGVQSDMARQAEELSRLVQDLEALNGHLADERATNVGRLAEMRTWVTDSVDSLAHHQRSLRQELEAKMAASQHETAVSQQAIASRLNERLDRDSQRIDEQRAHHEDLDRHTRATLTELESELAAVQHAWSVRISLPRRPSATRGGATGAHAARVANGTDADEPVRPALPDPGHRHVDALLACDDLTFVHRCYLWLLDREPDPAGMAHYRQRLETGTAKTQVLFEIANSKEYRQTGQPLAGLDKLIRNQRLSRWLSKR